MIKYICNNCEKETEDREKMLMGWDFGLCVECGSQFNKEKDKLNKEHNKIYEGLKSKYNLNQ